MITIDIKTLLIYLVFIALIIFLVYLSILTKNLIKTLKKTNAILDDAQVISGIAADRAEDLDGVVGDVKEAVTGITDAVKGQQSVIGGLSNLIKAVGSLVAIFKKNESDK